MQQHNDDSDNPSTAPNLLNLAALANSMTELEMDDRLRNNSSSTTQTVRPPAAALKTCYSDEPSILEIGVDEVGRGPLLGRVYAGAAVLPKDKTRFNHALMKDSKRFSSATKMLEAEAYIKTHSIAWAVAYEDETVIDNINILQATQSAMHKAITLVKRKLTAAATIESSESIVAGNYFKPF